MKETHPSGALYDANAIQTSFITKQIIPNILGTIVGAWFNYFAIVKKQGCMWCYFCCFEGSTVLLVLAILNIVMGIMFIWTFIVGTTGVTMSLLFSKLWVGAIVLFFNFLRGALAFPLGFNMYKLAQDPASHESHVRDLKLGDSDEAASSEPESSEA